MGRVVGSSSSFLQHFCVFISFKVWKTYTCFRMRPGKNMLLKLFSIKPAFYCKCLSYIYLHCVKGLKKVEPFDTSADCQQESASLYCVLYLDVLIVEKVTLER